MANPYIVRTLILASGERLPILMDTRVGNGKRGCREITRTFGSCPVVGRVVSVVAFPCQNPAFLKRSTVKFCPVWRESESPLGFYFCESDGGDAGSQNRNNCSRISAGVAVRFTVENRIGCPWITTVSSTIWSIAGCNNNPLAKSASASPRPTCERR